MPENLADELVGARLRIELDRYPENVGRKGERRIRETRGVDSRGRNPQTVVDVGEQVVDGECWIRIAADVENTRSQSERIRTAPHHERQRLQVTGRPQIKLLEHRVALASVGRSDSRMLRDDRERVAVHVLCGSGLNRHVDDRAGKSLVRPTRVRSLEVQSAVALPAGPRAVHGESHFPERAVKRVPVDADGDDGYGFIERAASRRLRGDRSVAGAGVRIADPGLVKYDAALFDAEVWVRLLRLKSTIKIDDPGDSAAAARHGSAE